MVVLLYTVSVIIASYVPEFQLYLCHAPIARPIFVVVVYIMASVSEILNGSITATSFTGNGAAITNLTRGNISTGTPNQIVVNNGSGALSSVAQITPSQGGTGIDSSSSTGVGKVAAGTWSVAAVVDSDVSASAAIQRSKIATGTANQIVVNNGSGALSSVAQITPSQGGTGIDLSGVTGPALVSVTGGVVSTVNYGTAATGSTVVLRNGSGGFSAGPITTTSITSGGALSLGGTSVNFNTAPVTFNPTTISGSLTTMLAADVQTTNTTATTLFTIATASTGTHGTTYMLKVQIALGDASGGVNTASYNFMFQAKNIGGTVTVSALVGYISVTEGTLSGTSVTATSSSANVLVQVNGLAATNINWSGFAMMTQQDF